MPMHDWTRVDAGIYHAFHQAWIIEISRSLNEGLLPGDFYALPEQHAGGFGPDVVALQDRGVPPDAGVQTKAKPKTSLYALKPTPFYIRKQNAISVRHVSGDRIVAMIEIVSPGNKSSQRTLEAFVRKAWELLDRGVHLLIVDPIPPGKRDPNGIHGAIWSEDDIEGEPFVLQADKPLTLVAYECSLVTEAYIETIAVGDPLPDMPVFLEPGFHVMAPLEATYSAAWNSVPARWRRVVAPTES